ncbi:hypothetical protein L596_002076 [Steinernema carpocapsae]|uniref:Uncharacterized protein n=1 Tax=Steinernema carpocapsae TaxID=34508 RepID=A0A4U8UN45_STECR|nr:hypothetical protein L596_002076 [Steinernema carpocapsae]
MTKRYYITALSVIEQKTLVGRSGRDGRRNAKRKDALPRVPAVRQVRSHAGNRRATINFDPEINRYSSSPPFANKASSQSLSSSGQSSRLITR